MLCLNYNIARALLVLSYSYCAIMNISLYVRTAVLLIK